MSTGFRFIKNVSLDSIVAELGTMSPENIKKNEKVTSRLQKDKNGDYQETFYTWDGYSTSVGDYRVLVEKGSALYSGQNNPNDGKQKSLGFRIKLLKRGRVIKTFKGNDNTITGIYECVNAKAKEYENKKREEDSIYFNTIIERLTSQTPDCWERYVENWESVPKNIRATSFFHRLELYSTRIEGLEVILEEKTTQIGDLVGGDGSPIPYPYSDPSVDYRMKLLTDGKITKVFEGNDYTHFISSSIQILREYHKKQQYQKQAQLN